MWRGSGEALLARIDFHNSTALSSVKLLTLMSEAVAGWAVGRITVRVRYSRGADFSGTCVYSDRKILINLGRHLKYPYHMGTNLARAKTIGRRWYKPIYTLELQSGYEVILFVFMHELYHLLVKRARRNIRQKESMCDRFAARYVVERFGAIVRNDKGEPVPDDVWEFQDLEGFVAAARDRRAARHPIPRRKHQQTAERDLPSTPAQDGQLLLFPV